LSLLAVSIYSSAPLLCISYSISTMDVELVGKIPACSRRPFWLKSKEHRRVRSALWELKRFTLELGEGRFV
jgi:hypothetical protein